MSTNLALILSVSLKIAFLSSILVMITAFGLALWLYKSRSLSAKIIELIIYIPMAMPPVALGYGLLILFGPHSIIGIYLKNLNIQIAFSFLGAVLASYIVSLGIGLRAMRLALENIDEHHVHSAELLGANKLQIFWHIILPLCKRSLLGGFILVFLRSIGEFGATIILAGNALGSTRTLALAIWTEMQTPGQEYMTLLLVIIAALLSLGALLVSEIMLRKK